MDVKNNISPPQNNIAAITISTILLGGATTLLLFKFVSETIFLALCTLSLFTGFLVFFASRIQSVQLNKFQLTLKDIKEREELAKKLALSIADLSENFYKHGLIVGNFDKEAHDEKIKKLKELAES